MEGDGTGPAADVFAKFAPVREWVRDLRLDTVIVIYNDHASAFSLELLPTFAIGAAESYAPAGHARRTHQQQVRPKPSGGALGEDVAEVHSAYHVPVSNTAAGLVAIEDRSRSAR
jgi:Catalytic LigB subunit of aromatic ring-opening dioxygenase